jgi:3D (Asp-Asp-Asp) domain-containing protein
MKHLRFVLPTVALLGLLGAYTVTSHHSPAPKPVRVASAALAFDDTLQEQRLLRASRSRLYLAAVAPIHRSTSVVHPTARVVTIRSRPATRRADLPSNPQPVHKAVDGALHDITEYCDTGSRNAAGRWPQPGDVAVIDRSIPFGTHVYIEGVGNFVVEDWIGHGSEFDIFTHSCAAADAFGRQHHRVFLS